MSPIFFSYVGAVLPGPRQPIGPLILCYDGCMSTSIQPGLLRIFRYFTGIAMVYFAILGVFSFTQGEGYLTSQIQIYLNLATNLALFGYLSWSWLQRKLKAWYLIIALLVATIVPIFSNLFYLAEPVERDLSLVIARSWLLFPILVVPLVLIAWQYGYAYVMLFILVTTAVEFSVLYPVVGRIDFATLPILGLPFIRAFAFATVGNIVTHLIITQRAQSKALLKANYRLNQHAETLKQLAVSQERNRLARELHDTLAHTLSGQTVNLEAIKLMVPPENPEIINMLDQALTNTRNGLSETRRALKALRSLPLEDLGLSISIRNLAKDIALRGAFELTLAVADNLPPLRPEFEQGVYRIAQESLENIARHARATHVNFQLGIEDHSLKMEIEDNGKGVNFKEVDFNEKLGIKGMYERAAEINGLLKIASKPGQGMTIQLTVKVPDDQSDDL